MQKGDKRVQNVTQVSSRSGYDVTLIWRRQHCSGILRGKYYQHIMIAMIDSVTAGYHNQPNLKVWLASILYRTLNWMLAQGVRGCMVAVGCRERDLDVITKCRGCGSLWSAHSIKLIRHIKCGTKTADWRLHTTNTNQTWRFGWPIN